MFHDEDEELTVESRLDILEKVMERMCGRLDDLELLLLEIREKLLEKEKEKIESSSMSQEFSEAQITEECAVLEETGDAATCVPEESNEIIQETDFVNLMYCGQPEGQGFEGIDVTMEKTPRSLYAIHVVDDNVGHFFPLADNVYRFKNSSKTLLYPVCEVDGDIMEAEKYIVKKENHGIVKKQTDGYWCVERKCVVTCL